jgi:predicted RNA-binding Zn-ribbon protein involved in translation (DUF1610 family)
MESFDSPVSEKHQFPCKNCGASLTFAPGTNSLVCQYCQTLNEIEVQDVAIEEIDYENFIANRVSSAEKVQIAVVKCDSCGAESSLKPNVTSDLCPFCGTALVISSGSLQTEIKPKSVLPFKIQQKEGFDLFKKWIKSLWFAPDGLKKFADSPDRLNGMYLPYWTYDTQTTTRYTGQRGEYYYVTETYRDSNNQTQTRQVQKTQWYAASGVVENFFDDMLINASQSLPREYVQELEPWDLPELVPFDERYLSGFRTESYQVDVQQGFVMAKERMEPAIDSTIRQDIGGDTQMISSKSTNYRNITFKHILLPVWLSAYRYNDKVYRFMINARTGEVQGERPWSWVKIALAVLVVLLLVAGLFYLRGQGNRRYRGEVQKELFFSYQPPVKSNWIVL